MYSHTLLGSMAEIAWDEVKHIYGPIYFIDTLDIADIYDIFFNKIDGNIPKICITTRHPNLLYKNLMKDNVQMYWLTRNPDSSVNGIDSSKISALSSSLINFIDENCEGIILFDGVEYLIIHNDFLTIVRFFHYLKDIIADKNFAVFAPIRSDIFEKNEISILDRGFTYVDAKDLMDRLLGRTEKRKDDYSYLSSNIEVGDAVVSRKIKRSY